MSSSNISNDGDNTDDKSIENTMEKLGMAIENFCSNEGINANISYNRETGTIRVYNSKTDMVQKASSALSEVLELAYTTAEHHPYWSILYHGGEISKTILECWNAELKEDQISEMLWRAEEIKQALARLSSMQT